MKLSLWLRTLRMLFAAADDKSKPAETLQRAERAVQIVEDTVDEIKRYKPDAEQAAASPIGEAQPDPPPARAPAAPPPAGSAADPAADPPPPQTRP